MKILASIWLFLSIIRTEASSDLIKETREKIAQINVSLLGNSSPGDSFVDGLDTLLSEMKSKYILTGSTVEEKDYKIKSHQLIKSFKTFERFYRSKAEFDTLKKVFRVVNNEFNSLFGNYFLDELNKSMNKKIIVFSTSISCECTLEMCYKQESEIQQLLKENPDLFGYAVVDCFTNFDLQSKYEIGFIPVVLVMDEKGKELKRFVREEKTNEIISYILKMK